jgi:pimeloyl-ACP methyl ester carboxylesterase
MSSTAAPHTTGTVISADDTTIGYRQFGAGPGVILMHGGMQASQHYTRLARSLADAFTVYVPDRRGRGMSGPPGEKYCIARESEDLDALLTATGAHRVWGHSSGGLVALQTALTNPSIHKLAVYEPALSMYGAIPLGWLPRFERELDQGKLADAVITFTKGTKAHWAFALMPRWLLALLLNRYLQKEKQTLKPDEVSMEALIPTQRYDGRIFAEMASSKGFADLRADMDVMLMNGQNTPPPVRNALDALQETLPHAQRVEFPGIGHDGPATGDPERVGKALQTFFAQPS